MTRSKALILLALIAVVAIVWYMLRPPSASLPRTPAELPESVRPFASPDVNVRDTALIELERRKQKGDISPTEASHIFQAIILVQEPAYGAKAAAILAELNYNEKILLEAKRAIDEKRSDYAIIASLAYYKKQHRDEFLNYFQNTPFPEIPKLVKEQFANTNEMQIVRQAHFVNLLKNCLLWQQSPRGMRDSPNPYFAKLAESGLDIIPFIIAASEKSPEDTSPYLVRSMGMIGSPDCLPLLLGAFKATQRYDIALAIGSSWRPETIKKVFSDLEEPKLRHIFEIVLEGHSFTLKDKTNDEIQAYVLEHLSEIIETSKFRSRIVMG